MATAGGKSDKAHKDRQNKMTLMEKVLMRDKHDKVSKKDRNSKANSKDLDVVTETVQEPEHHEGSRAKHHKAGGKEKVKMRDKGGEKSSHRKDRDSKSLSRELFDLFKENKDSDSESADGVKQSKSSSLMDKVLMRDKHDKTSKKDRESKVPSRDLQDLTSSREDVSRVDDDGTVHMREKDERYHRKDKNRRSVYKWFKHITEAAEAYKGKEKPASRRTVRSKPPTGVTVPDVSATDPGQDEEKIQEEEEEEVDRERKDSKEEAVGGLLERHASSSVDSVENLEQAEVLHIKQSADLIQPSEVQVSDTSVMVEHAQPVLSDHELLMEKDRLISKSIEEKQQLVAQILNVPPQDFQHVAEMATEVEGEKETRELLLAAIYQATQLTSLLNASLNLHTATKASTVTLHSHGGHSNGIEGQLQPTVQEVPIEVNTSEDSTIGEETTDSGNATESSGGITKAAATVTTPLTVTLPCQQVNTISSRLNQHLAQLLNVMNRREEEHERLQRALKLTPEQLLQLKETPISQDSSTSQPTSRPGSFVSLTSSASEAGEGDTSAVTEDTTAISVSSDDNAFNISSQRPKLTPIVVSHVVTSEVAMEKLSTLSINDPSENVMTSTPAALGELNTSQETQSQNEEDSDSSESSAGSENAVTSQDDVIKPEAGELV